MGKNKKTLVKLIAVAIIVIAAASAYMLAAKTGESMGKQKILLIGIDAFDAKTVESLMAQGKLPNFERLSETGSYARLETTIPPETPVAWTAAATGNNPGRYGIFDYINRDADSYTPRLSLANEKQGLTGTKYESANQGTPFWRITSGAGIPTTVIRWPVTFPAEKVKGRMLSGLGVVDIKGFLNGYKFYTSGSYDNQSEGAEKVIPVAIEDGKINTSIFGPLTRKDGSLVEKEKPMGIVVSNGSAMLMLDGSAYSVREKGWSDWIRVKFKADMFTDVYGIFRVYLLSTQPFEMYMTTIQIDPENQIADITYPKEYGQELAEKIGLFNTLGMPEDTKAVTENRIGKDVFLEQIKQIEGERTKMFWYEFNRFDSGIYAFGFDAGDRLQHLFWTQKVLTASNSTLPKEIEDYYTEKDAFLGQVLDKMDGDTKLIIFSDHGFDSFERAVTINRWLVDNGYMALTQEPAGREEGGLFKYVDWSKTRAYSLGFASVYINVRGREGQGIVDESQKDKLVDEIASKLSNLADADGKSVIKNVYKGREIYSGPYAEDGPDMIVGFQEGYRMSWQNAVGGLTAETINDNTQAWTGDHLIDRSFVPAVLFTNFKIKKADPKITDIAPTVLKLELLPASDMDGEALV